MKLYKKAITGGVVTFMLGISCCWLSSLAIWLGGATIMGTTIKTIEDTQLKLVIASLILLIGSGYLYRKRKKYILRMESDQALKAQTAIPTELSDLQ